MIPLTYDLHIHSCLSPCGDDDMTPCNISGMAAVKELDVIALTDHNSCKNCPAFVKSAKEYGIIPIPGMELCTKEEVHVLCLFQTLEDAMRFDEYIDKQLIPIKNDESIFGKQEIYNEEDKVERKEENLLISATNIPFHSVYDLVNLYHGIMIPAHIDKSTNSVLSNLGFIPPESKFTCVELKNMNHLKTIRTGNSYLSKCKVITSSDAHYLEDINEPVHYLHAKTRDIKDVFAALK